MQPQLASDLIAREDFRQELLSKSLALLGRPELTVVLEIKSHPRGLSAIAPL